jgi:hypothetical protein
VSVSSLKCQKPSDRNNVVFSFGVSSLGVNLKILNQFRKWLFVLMLGVASSAQAVVVMTDGMLVTYDPNETYVPSGTLGPDIFSIGWIYTDPTYSNTINLTMPSTLVGQMLWGVSSGIDGSGTGYSGGSMVAGETISLTMGGFPLASISNPLSEWFSMAAFDMPTPIAFGPTVGGDLISLPAVPEPSTVWMFAAGLVVIAGVARRRLVA